MKTNKTKQSKKSLHLIIATIVMLFMCIGTVIPAYANNEPVAGGIKTFKKHLVMDDKANVPNVTFKFNIKAGQAVDAKDGNPAIYAGIGSPTVSDATFTSGMETRKGEPTDSTSTQTSNKKYASKDVNVNFTNVTFHKPGIYRYIITEEKSSVDGIVNDTIDTRTLDVYVIYEDNSDTELKISNYIMYKGTLKDNVNLKTNKTDCFINTYETNDLTLKKDVTGNQGNRDQYFEFNISINNAVAGTVYTVDLSSADQSSDTKTNQSTLTVGKDGTVTSTYYLKDNQSIMIQGMTEKTNYNITEKDYSADGYDTSVQLDNKEIKNITTGEQSIGNTDHTIIFTNHKEGVIPTGIILEIMPYLILAAVVIVGFVALSFTRKRHIN